MRRGINSFVKMLGKLNCRDSFHLKMKYPFICKFIIVILRVVFVIGKIMIIILLVKQLNVAISRVMVMVYNYEGSLHFLLQRKWQAFKLLHCTYACSFFVAVLHNHL